MSLHTTWQCIGRPPRVQPCGAHGTTDASANRHVRDTGHGTGAVTTCWVTLTTTRPGTELPLCGQPVTQGALCAKHAADARRLGGTP